MTAAITSSAIIFIGFYIYSGDVLASVAFSLGPVAAHLFFEKEEIVKDDLKLPAGEWFQKAIGMFVIGIVYTGGVLFILAVVSLFIPYYDILFSPLLLAAIQFLPHPFVYWNRKQNATQKEAWDEDRERIGNAWQQSKENLDGSKILPESTQPEQATTDTKQVEIQPQAKTQPSRSKDSCVFSVEINGTLFEMPFNRIANAFISEQSFIYDDRKEARTIADALSMEYPNIRFAVVDRTDRNDPFARRTFNIKAKQKSKAPDNVSTATKTAEPEMVIPEYAIESQTIGTTTAIKYPTLGESSDVWTVPGTGKTYKTASEAVEQAEADQRTFNEVIQQLKDSGPNAELMSAIGIDGSPVYHRLAVTILKAFNAENRKAQLLIIDETYTGEPVYHPHDLTELIVELSSKA